MNQNKRNSINIPAVLVHTINDVEYRVNGKIVGINESNDTVSMRFKGHKGIEHGIPMSSVYVNEGILDSIKKAGKKVMGTIQTLVRKVRGFLYLVIDGQPDPNSINAPINLAVSASNGRLAGVQFFPNANLVTIASENGIDIDDEEPYIDADEMEIESIETYWGRVMQNYVQNESYTIHDAVNFVNEHYYVDRLKKARKLNEGFVLSLNNPPEFSDKYGEELSLSEIKSELIQNIISQVSREIGEPLANYAPYIIWGAPGIGKTACLNLLAKELKEVDGINLNIQTVQCSGLAADDWGLPAKQERKALNTRLNKDGKYDFDTDYATSIPQAWLPVYRLSNDPDYNEQIDNYFNSGEAQPGNKERYDGGIIFFDELTRLPKNAQNMMMALVDQGKYNDMTLASHWALVFAANRWEDVLSDTSAEKSDFVWETAKARRFQHVTFVPSKAEWLEWARGKNSNGIQNIGEAFCKFIELSDDKVWYATLDNGGFDNYLSDDERTEVQDYARSLQKTSGTDARDNIATLMADKMGAESMMSVTPATWQKVSDKLNEFLSRNLFRRHPELLKMCYVDGQLKDSSLSKALNMLSPSEWESFYNTWKNRLDKSGRLANNRLTFIKEYISKRIMAGLLGKDSAAMSEWDTYNNYRSVFTPDIIDSIWNTGEMPAGPIRKDDDKFFEQIGEYKLTEFSKWKFNPAIAEEVIDLVFDNYPGGIQNACQQIKEDAAKIKSAAPLTDAEMDKLFDKYQKKYSVKINKTTKKILYAGNTIAAKDKENMRALLHTLDNSIFSQLLLNVVKYFAKVGFQMQQGGTLIIRHIKNMILPGRGTYINELIKSDAEIGAILYPTTEISKAQKTGTAEILLSGLIAYSSARAIENALNDDRRIAMGK